MALVILTFDPNEPEERDSLRLALDAWKYQAALSELDEFLRSKLKYEELTDDVTDAFEECRAKLHNALEERSIDLW